MILLKCLLLTISIVFIIDFSGFLTNLSKFIYEKTTGKVWLGQLLPRPFSCSLCMTFWLTFLLLISNYSIIFTIFYSSIFAFLTSFIKQLFQLAYKIIFKIK
jgi:hypothetical protein